MGARLFEICTNVKETNSYLCMYKLLNVKETNSYVCINYLAPVMDQKKLAVWAATPREAG